MSVRWMLAGSLIAWLALIAPPLVLASWLLSFPAWTASLAGIVIAPWVLRSVLASLRRDNSPTRWWWVQALGAGTLLMLLLPFGAVATLVWPSPAVGLAVLLAWLLAIVGAARQALHVREQHLSIVAPALDKPVRLVQISDVHIGSRPRTFMASVVRQVERHRPDIVVITGDLLDTASVTSADLSALAALSCPTVMCIGNHERYVPLEAALAAIRDNGVTVLRDATVAFGSLQLLGIDDRDQPDDLPEILQRLIPADSESSVFHVLLYHRPDGWAAARAAGVPLTLSGHTHGGQIWPFGLLVKRRYPETTGLFTQDGARLYVSPGTGTWGPTLRLGTRSEMTIIDLQTQGHPC